VKQHARRTARLGRWTIVAAVALSGAACNPAEYDKWKPSVPGPELTDGLSIVETQRPVTESSPLLPPYPNPPQPGALEITVEQAVMMAIENNAEVRVERLNPAISRTFVDQELAAFDPVLSVPLTANRERDEDRFGNEGVFSDLHETLAATQFLPTGTTVGLGATTERTWGDGLPDQHATRVSASVTQSLLRGAGVAVNLASLRQAKLDRRMSEYEFRGFAESFVADVEITYWRYVLALRSVSIVEESLKLAEQQLDETNQRIRVGTLAETERAAAQAEVAQRRESLINARSLADTLRVALGRLIVPQGANEAPREINPTSPPVIPPAPVADVSDHIAVALRLRSDLNEARLELQKDEIEIVRTKNGLLPKMDLFIGMGRTGYASSFGQSVRDVGEGYDVLATLNFEYPIHNRQARAEHRRALLNREQQQEAIDNLAGLVLQDVQTAYIEVQRTRQQVDATRVTREAQQEKLRAEVAKYKVGRSTSFQVAQAQRDLLESQVAEVVSVANYINSRIDLFRQEGSLLARQGLEAPGIEPTYLIGH
jgi:outer membrane protein TolC